MHWSFPDEIQFSPIWLQHACVFKASFEHRYIFRATIQLGGGRTHMKINGRFTCMRIANLSYFRVPFCSAKLSIPLVGSNQEFSAFQVTNRQTSWTWTVLSHFSRKLILKVQNSSFSCASSLHIYYVCNTQKKSSCLGK